MTILETKNLTAFYGNFQALFGINIHLNVGETIAIIGANGAGKTTLMRSISGIITNEQHAILNNSEEIGNLHAADIILRGIAMVPEGRKLFPSLTVEENIRIGAYGKNTTGTWNLESIYELFPVLKERRKSPGTLLSGGQQQMVAIARALISNPKILLCDEISLGLAPVIIQEIYTTFEKIRASGSSVIIVEQDISRALRVCDRFYCMTRGKIVLEGSPADHTQQVIHDAYFGVSQ